MNQEDREAARNGDLPHLTTALAGRLTGASKDEDARSLLHIACAGSSLPVVELIAEHGGKAVVNETDEEGWTPLMSAVSAGQTAIATYLLSIGADASVSNSGGRTPLHYAASKGHLSCLKLLLAAGANPDFKDHTGSTAMHRAASAGKAEALRMLVEQGARLEEVDKLGQTPLFVAVESGNQRVGLFLASRGAKLDATNREGESVLSIADAHLRAALTEAAARGPGEDDE